MGGFPLNRAAFIRQADQQIISSGEMRELEEELTLSDGKIHVHQLFKAPLRDPQGRIIGIFGVSRDVTERKKAEHALLDTEQRLTNLFDNMSEGVALHELVLDDEGKPVNYRIVNVNPAYEQILGRERSQVIGLLGNQAYNTPTPPYFEEFSRVAISGEPARLQTYFPPMDRHFEISIAPWGHHGFATIFLDVSERVRAEQERERLLKSEQAARQHAEAASRAKTELLNIVSHELRTPLTPILAAADILRINNSIDEEARDLVEIIRDGVQVEARLVNDLLDMTYLSTGKLPLTLAAVDAPAVLNVVLAMYREEIGRKNLTLRITDAAATSIVRADESRLRQILWNILGNAVKFTAVGGDIEIRTVNVVATDAAGPSRSRPMLRVEVQDSGIGFDAEFKQRMFGAFEQQDRSMTRRFGGLGLGLSLTKHLVELHGGSLQGQSQGKGMGATFVIELPLADESIDPRRLDDSLPSLPKPVV